MRLASIDVYRGACIAAMILVNAQFSPEASYDQFVHAEWDGWTFADTIFPCFLFIVGVSLTLSTASRLSRGDDRARLTAHAARRSLLLFACGVAIDYIRFPYSEFPFVGFQEHVQMTGVLQKISVCYLLAFMIFIWTGLRGVVAGIIGLNLVQIGLVYFFPIPACGAGSLTAACNFPDYLDRLVLNGYRSNSPGFDGDGLGAILPATSSVLFGVLAGHLLLRQGQSARRLLLLLAGGGVAMICMGQVLAFWIPLNKHLWSTSFAVLMAGIAACALAITHWIVEGRPAVQRWLRPLEVLGLNAIAAYLISRLVMHIPRVHVGTLSFHDDLLARIADPPAASMLFAAVVLCAVYIPIWYMDRMRWHLKF